MIIAHIIVSVLFSGLILACLLARLYRKDPAAFKNFVQNVDETINAVEEEAKQTGEWDTGGVKEFFRLFKKHWKRIVG